MRFVGAGLLWCSMYNFGRLSGWVKIPGSATRTLCVPLFGRSCPNRSRKVGQIVALELLWC
jgi:hypothetical protein